MTINTLIQDLKSAGQDYEFYPTTKDMVEVIYKDYCCHRAIHEQKIGSFLDI